MNSASAQHQAQLAGVFHPGMRRVAEGQRVLGAAAAIMVEARFDGRDHPGIVLTLVCPDPALPNNVVVRMERDGPPVPILSRAMREDRLCIFGSAERSAKAVMPTNSAP